MGAEEDGPNSTAACQVSWIGLRSLSVAARPCRAGAPSAEPGGGRASGAAGAALINLLIRGTRLIY